MRATRAGSTRAACAPPVAGKPDAFALGGRRTATSLPATRVIGVGRFAEDRIRHALSDTAAARQMPDDLVIGRVPHPSPASPAANRNWSRAMTRALSALGIELPAP